MPERRAYPRIDSDLPGLLEFRVPTPSDPARGDRPVNVPVAVSSISCEGASVRWLVAPGGRDLPDRRVTLHFAIDDARYRMPAMVAWSSYPDHSGVAEVGLRLELAASPAATRHAFAEWIAIRTAAAKPSRSDHDHHAGHRRVGREPKPR